MLDFPWVCALVPGRPRPAGRRGATRHIVKNPDTFTVARKKKGKKRHEVKGLGGNSPIVKNPDTFGVTRRKKGTKRPEVKGLGGNSASVKFPDNPARLADRKAHK